MTKTTSVTSSTSAARSTRTLVLTARRAGRLWLGFITKPHSLVSEVSTLGLGQLITPRPNCCSERPWRLLLGSRLIGLHLLCRIVESALWALFNAGNVCGHH